MNTDSLNPAVSEDLNTPIEISFYICLFFSVMLVVLPITGTIYVEIKQRRRKRCTVSLSDQYSCAISDHANLSSTRGDYSDRKSEHKKAKNPQMTIMEDGCPRNPCIVGRTLEIFSLQENLPAVLSMKREPGMSSLNGIRVLSLFSIILVHTCQTAGECITENTSYFWESLSNPLYLLFGSGPISLSVDCFFLISGLLSTSSLLNRMRNSGGKITFQVTLKYIYNRVVRLQPLHLYVVSLSVVLFSWIPWHSLSSLFTHLIVNCQNYWWTNVLFVVDFVPILKTCLPWTWYLASDFQFYVLTPVLIFVYMKAKRVMFATVGILFLILFLVSGTLSYVLQLPIRYKKMVAPVLVSYSDNYYKMPFCRYGPFLLGNLLGIFMFKRKELVIMNKKQVLTGWVCSLCAMVLVMALPFVLDDSKSSYSTAAATYQASHRIIWAAAIGWIIFACEQGYGGIVHKMFSWDIWNFLSKISYAAYLVHATIVIVYLGLQERSLHFSAINTIYMFFGNCAVTLVAAVALTVLVERPFQQALRL